MHAHAKHIHRRRLCSSFCCRLHIEGARVACVSGLPQMVFDMRPALETGSVSASHGNVKRRAHASTVSLSSAADVANISAQLAELQSKRQNPWAGWAADLKSKTPETRNRRGASRARRPSTQSLAADLDRNAAQVNDIAFRSEKPWSSWMRELKSEGRVDSSLGGSCRASSTRTSTSSDYSVVSI